MIIFLPPSLSKWLTHLSKLYFMINTSRVILTRQDENFSTRWGFETHATPPPPLIESESKRESIDKWYSSVKERGTQGGTFSLSDESQLSLCLFLFPTFFPRLLSKTYWSPLERWFAWIGHLSTGQFAFSPVYAVRKCILCPSYLSKRTNFPRGRQSTTSERKIRQKS